MIKDTFAQVKITASDIGAPTNELNDAALGNILTAVYMVIVIIVGGIRYTTSNGDAAGVKSAKNTILYAVVGLIVIIMASAITQFVIQGTSGS